MLRCPRCGQPAARRSRRAGAADHLLSVLHLYPFRCQLCTARFRAFQARHHSQPGTERREYDRLAVRVPARLTGGGTEAEGETLDLSLDGCSLRAEAVFPPGITVRVRLGLGRAGDVDVRSAVVRSQHEGVLGLQFTQLAPPERQRLSRYLDRFLRPSGTPARRAGRSWAALALVTALGAGVIVGVLALVARLGGVAR